MVKRGFAAMTPERRREIAAMGGKAAHENGVAHCFTSEAAKVAGSKGGKAPHRVRGRGQAAATSESAVELPDSE